MNQHHGIAVITGAERGLGRELARRLAQVGMIVLPTSRELELSEQVVGEIRQAGGNAHAECLDVRDEATIERFARRVKSAFGQVDVLINNAGVSLDMVDSVLEVDLDVVKETLETNLFGAWRVVRALAPLLRKSPHGRIVNISSTMGQLEAIGHTAPAYRLSKAALNALTGMLAHELQDTGILVNAVDPGWMRTEMGGPTAPLSVEEGAEEPLRLALLGPAGTTGGFYFRGRLLPW